MTSKQDSSKELNVTPGKMLGKGGNSTCYQLKQQNKVLLVHSSGFATNPSQIIKSEKEKYKIINNLPKQVNIVRMHNVGLYKGKAALVLEKAPGKEIHQLNPSYKTWNEELEILKNAPQNAYDQLVADVLIAAEAGLEIDPSKPTNFFYDTKTNTFTLIDLNLDSKATVEVLSVPLIWTAVLFSKHKKRLTPQNTDQIKQIIHKLNNSLQSLHKVTKTEKKMQKQILDFLP